MSTAPEARLEIYACVWQDESFRAGWTATAGAFSSDGDVGTLTCPEDLEAARAEKELPAPLSTDEARYLAVRITGFSGSGWRVEGRDTSGTWHDLTGTSTAIGYREFELPPGLALEKVALCVLGPGSQLAIDLLAFLREPRRVIRPVSLRVVRRLNACSELEAVCPSSWAEDVRLSDEVKALTGERKLFCGRLVARELRSEGGAISWACLRAVGQGWPLLAFRAERRAYSGPVSQVIRELVEPLVRVGLLTAESVVEGGAVVSLALSDEDVSVLEALAKACEAAGYCFYVDHGGDLHAFPRGSLQAAAPLQPLAFTLKEEAGEIANDIAVLGAPERTEPPEGDFTARPELWSLTAGEGSLAPDDEEFFTTPPSIRLEQTGQGPLVVRLELPEPLDLRPELASARRKELCFFARWEGVIDPLLTVRCCDGDTGYFEHPNCLATLPPGEWGVPDTGSRKPVKLPLASPAWRTVGQPSWAHITHLEFEIQLKPGAKLWLDGVLIRGFRFRGRAMDEESVRAFGRRQVVLVDDAVRSDEEARERAELLLAASARPRTRLEDLVVLGLPEVELGARLSVELPGYTGEHVVSEVEHVLTAEGAKTRISCSSTGEQSPGWQELLRRREGAASLAAQVRELEVPTAPQARVPSSHVVAGPDRLLSDLLTEDGLVGPDGLVPFISRALGRLHEAEEALGPAGSEVEEPSASNGRAVMASKGGPGGVMIELI